jgi:hypothetical protein
MTGSTVGHLQQDDENGHRGAVTLTVTDNGATGTASKDVTVTSGSTAFTLGATGYEVKGLQKADLTWSGATTTSVDINNKGSASDTYKVCDAAATTCSNEVTVVF